MSNFETHYVLNPIFFTFVIGFIVGFLLKKSIKIFLFFLIILSAILFISFDYNIIDIILGNIDTFKRGLNDLKDIIYSYKYLFSIGFVVGFIVGFKIG